MYIEKSEKKTQKRQNWVHSPKAEDVEVQPFVLILREKGAPSQNTLKSSGALALGALLSIWNLFPFTDQKFWLLNSPFLFRTLYLND